MQPGVKTSTELNEQGQGAADATERPTDSQKEEKEAMGCE